MAMLTRILLTATMTVAVLVAPAFGANEDHDAMKDMSGSAQPMESMEGMDAVGHDHEKVMEEAGATVGIEEKLGNILADVELTDSEGNRVSLRELTEIGRAHV